MKIANDIRWLSSGPRCAGGLIFPKTARLLHHARQSESHAVGSCHHGRCQVVGSDAAIGFAGSQGNFELRLKPVMIFNYLLRRTPRGCLQILWTTASSASS
jgi:fumarate hydratase class II